MNLELTPKHPPGSGVLIALKSRFVKGDERKIMSNQEKIQTEVVFKATAKLQAQIEQELTLETPDIEKAKAIIYENSSRNESRDGFEGHTES